MNSMEKKPYYTKTPYYTFPQSVRYTIRITQDNDKILRRIALKKGDVSKIINDLITKEYAPKPAEDPAQHT